MAGDIGKRRAAAVLSSYKHIESDLRRRIVQEGWAAGVMLPGRETLAREYRVSVGTVQRAVNRLVVDGILRADRRRGTFVAGSAPQGEAAAAGKPRRSIIAAVVPQGAGAGDPMVNAIVSGINRMLKEGGSSHHVVTFNSHAESAETAIEVERGILAKIEQEHMAAVVLWHNGGDATLPAVMHLRDIGTPVIFVDRCPSDTDCDSVLVDNYSGAREAGENLLSLGHTRIGVISTAERVGPILERERGYADALDAVGCASDPSLIRRTSYRTLRRDMPSIVAHFLHLPERPTALLIVQDGIAHMFMSAAAESGWTVPDDVSVIGFDDIDRYSYRPPLLTTVRQPFEEVGRAAARLLLRRLDSLTDRPLTDRSPRCQQIVLSTQLVVRATCRQVGEG